MRPGGGDRTRAWTVYTGTHRSTCRAPPPGPSPGLQPSCLLFHSPALKTSTLCPTESSRCISLPGYFHYLLEYVPQKQRFPESSHNFKADKLFRHTRKHSQKLQDRHDPTVTERGPGSQGRPQAGQLWEVGSHKSPHFVAWPGRREGRPHIPISWFPWPSLFV